MHTVPLLKTGSTPPPMTTAGLPAAWTGSRPLPKEKVLERNDLPAGPGTQASSPSQAMQAVPAMPPDLSDLAPILGRYSRTVYSIALRLTGDPADAEEVAQDVFLELHRTQPALESEDHLKYWLRRVAVHRSTDRLRRRKRQPETNADEWMDDLHGAPRPVAGLAPGTESRLDDLVRALPETLRTAVVLRYTEDLTPDEIARQLGQPVATVKSHLSRGLNMLRQKAAVTMKEYKRERA